MANGSGFPLLMANNAKSQLRVIANQIPVCLTAAAYDALPASKLTDGKLYVIVG